MGVDFVSDRALDAAASIFDVEADRLYLCSGAPADFAGIAAVTLGVKNSLNVGAPADGTPDGRQVTIAAFTDGSVSASGIATNYAVVNVAASRLLAVGRIASQSVTAGNTFGMPNTTITFRDAL